jgi:hypothetical protein
MERLVRLLRGNRKLIASALLPLGILGAVVIATGGDLFGGGSSGTTTVVGTAPPPASTVTPTSASKLQGTVTTAVNHGSGPLWQFTYTVHNTGKTPLGGFQLNAQRSNLWAITGHPGWAVFGTGVCGKGPTGTLVYWSTGSTATEVLRPGESAQFGFKVNTSRAVPLLYSISWDGAPPQFGTVQGPAPSALAASGPCKR